MTARAGAVLVSQIERVPIVYRVTIRLCEECIRGHGDVCYVPECAFWMKAVPEGGLMVDDGQWEDEG